MFLHDSQDFCLDVDWKLGTDPGRPNKRSKKFRFIILEETIEDYKNIDNDYFRKSFDQRLLSYTTYTMDSFDPEYDIPYGAATPKETIYLPFSVM